jgi:hypothetical protein
MKLVARIVAGILVLLLWLLARGMQMNPHALDQTLGLGVHLIAVLLLFVVFFQWRGTAVEPLDPKTHRKFVAYGQFLGGGTVLLAVLAFLLLGTYGGEVAQLIVSRRIDFLGVLVLLVSGIGALVAGFGILWGATWSKPLAKLVALPFSFGWPFGLLLALYTWWALAPPQRAQGS